MQALCSPTRKATACFAIQEIVAGRAGASLLCLPELGGLAIQDFVAGLLRWVVPACLPQALLNGQRNKMDGCCPFEHLVRNPYIKVPNFNCNFNHIRAHPEKG